MIVNIGDTVVVFKGMKPFKVNAISKRRDGCEVTLIDKDLNKFERINTKCLLKFEPESKDNKK